MLSRNGLASIAGVLAIFAVAFFSQTTAQQKSPPAQPAPPVIKPEDPKLPAGDPCALLTQAEVRNVFPNAASGTRSDTISAGILTCMWRSPDGYVRLSIMDSEPGESIADELASYAMAFVTDPIKGEDSQRSVVYETVNDVGDGAMAAIVERADPQHFLQAGAMLVARRGQISILLIAPTLAARGRLPALKALGDLGRTAAKRL